jgi:hypothetical protein
VTPPPPHPPATIAAIIDSTIFLYLAHLPHTPLDITALTLGKLYMIIATIPVIYALRRYLPAEQEKDDPRADAA